eukprot:GCRY01000835.1.p1 GENE.GCRY01000835.1~~GCRY01000835.1.p1  ORF type:complete len:265 (+),score=41.30 GCRY01000835.1:79-873(+)
MVKVGIIAGTGLDNPSILKNRKEIEVDTPFGKPSSHIVEGEIEGVSVALVFRHGVGHTIMPSHVNFRANIYALKHVGCTHVVGSSACGSLKEEYAPGHFVVVDQFIDRTTKREQSFYDSSCEEFKGICHIPMQNPFCSKIRQKMDECCEEMNLTFHKTGTIVVIEGPRFSSRAESNVFRSWNADLVGMTTVPEVVLAREAGMCYASIGMVTDYDCWKEESVSIPAVMAVMKRNSENVQKLFCKLLPKIKDEECGCQTDITCAVF